MVSNGLSETAAIRRRHAMRIVLRTLVLLLALTALAPSASWAQARPADRFEPGELVETGHRFFGGVSRGLATIIEKAVSQWGLPNGYVLGEEAGGAFFGGLRYGEGTLYTKNAGDLKVYFQGPSLGWHIGGDGARTMVLDYNLPHTHAIYQRLGGVDAMTAMTSNNIVLVPIRSGVGLRLGANVGYLKFTPQSTWNPF